MTQYEYLKTGGNALANPEVNISPSLVYLLQIKYVN